MDTNIENYTVDNLIDIFELDKDDLSVDNVMDKHNFLMSQSKSVEVKQFIKAGFEKILLHIDEEMENESIGDETEEYDDEETDEGDETEEYDEETEEEEREDGEEKMNSSNNIQNNNKIEGFEEMIGTSGMTSDKTKDNEITDPNHATYDQANNKVNLSNQVSVSQGNKNPILKNTIKKTLIIDSQYRQDVLTNNTGNASSDYIIDLEEPLTDVVSLKMYSIEIPFTWYVFDEINGTNVFYVDDTQIIIEPGNYLLDELCIEINSKLSSNNLSSKVSVTSSANNGKITFTIDKTISKILFYDKVNFTSVLRKNSSMGWIIGFRNTSYTNPNKEENKEENWKIKAESVADLYGPKYVMIYIDDFNQNKINNSVVYLSDNKNNTLHYPSYFTNDLSNHTDENGTITILPENPRRNTNAQRYAMNEILNNRTNTHNEKITPFSSTDVIGVVPIKKNGFPVGEAFIEYGGSLQGNERTYFGPVTISKIRVKLIGDKGELLNLNGSDWSFTLTCELLYQY